MAKLFIININIMYKTWKTVVIFPSKFGNGVPDSTTDMCMEAPSNMITSLANRTKRT